MGFYHSHHQGRDSIKKKDKIAVIFDTDADGVLSAAILLKGKYPHVRSLFPSSHDTLFSTLNHLDGQYDKIFILDIGLNPNDSRTFQAIKGQTDSGSTFIWFDTHKDTIRALSGIQYRGIICYNKDGATASLVHEMYGNRNTKRMQEMAAIIEKEVIVEKGNAMLKDVNTLAGALIGISSKEEYLEFIDTVMSVSDDGLRNDGRLQAYREMGDARVDAARKWLYTTPPIFGERKKGPAIWRTGDEKLFHNVSGKALRTVAYKRNGLCLLVIDRSDNPNEYRLKGQSPDSDDTDWKTRILNIIKKHGGTGGGHPRSFGGWVPREKDEKIISEIWGDIQR